MECQVIKINESLDNNELPIFGYFNVKFSKSDNASNYSNGLRITFGAGTNTTLKVVNGGSFTDATLEQTSTVEKKIVKNSEGYENIYIENENCRLIMDVQKVVKLVQVPGSGGYDKNFTWNIEDLADALMIDEIRSEKAKIYGDIIKLASAQVENGRTAGTIAIKSSGYITLDGAVVSNGVTKTITFDASLPNGYSVD